MAKSICDKHGKNKKISSWIKSDVRRPILSVNPPFVLLETLTSDKENKTSFLFADFKEILTFNSGDNLNLFFDKIETYLDKGYWLVGYFTYEFGYFLEPALFSFKLKLKSPLAWIGVCSKPFIEKGKTDKENRTSDVRFCRVGGIKINVSKKEYSAGIKK
ncbi:MAG: hypothetical protein ABIH08_02985 [Candidatus Omnitrophota bacterium]